MSHFRYVCYYCITEEFSLLNASDALFLFDFGVTVPPVGQGLLIQEVFLDHTLRRTTVGRTPLDE